MDSYDGVVIGAGHNGLTLAAYLARAGLKIGVVERNARVGGGCTTDEPALPGYRFNLHSNFFSWVSPFAIIHDLELYRFGFSYIEPLIQRGAAFRDGTCIVIHKDLDRTCASLARFRNGTPRRFASFIVSTPKRCARCSRRSPSTLRSRSTN
jgi:phytoene dehydrogenase-like protein